MSSDTDAILSRASGAFTETDGTAITRCAERINPFDFGESAMENVFIGISGLIGAGKTTLATALGKTLDLPAYFEPVVSNDYLADFYKDMKKHSFALQVHLLNLRFKQQQVIIWQGRGGVQDRTIYEDMIFAKMLMEQGLLEKRDFDTYRALSENMANFMKRPNLIVHLDVTPEESLERIKQRSRDCESTISIEYLRALERGYEEFISHISKLIPVIRINWSKYRTAEEMAEVIVQEYAKIQNIRHVNFEKRNSKPNSPI